MKLIMINGAPYSGKDTVANHLMERSNVYRARFKDPLYEALSLFYGLPLKEVEDLCNSPKEIKDSPHPKFNGKSPRGALIHMSEDVMKPNFGLDIVSKLTAKKIQCLELGRDYFDSELVVVMPDCGFPNEVEELQAMLGLDRSDIFLIRIEREGCSFEGDSRTYVPNPDLVIFNNSSLVDLYAVVNYSVINFLNKGSK